MWLVPPSRKFSLLSLKAVNNFIPSGTATLCGCLRCCRGSRALLGELGKSQTETSLVMVEPKGLSHGLLPLTSRVRKGTARCDAHVSLDTGSAVPPARGCPQEMTEETLLLHLVAVEQSWDGDSTGMEPAGERPGERRQRVGCAPPEPPVPAQPCPGGLLCLAIGSLRPQEFVPSWEAAGEVWRDGVVPGRAEGGSGGAGGRRWPGFHGEGVAVGAGYRWCGDSRSIQAVS